MWEWFDHFHTFWIVSYSILTIFAMGQILLGPINGRDGYTLLWRCVDEPENLWQYSRDRTSVRSDKWRRHQTFCSSSSSSSSFCASPYSSSSHAPPMLYFGQLYSFPATFLVASYMLNLVKKYPVAQIIIPLSQARSSSHISIYVNRPMYSPWKTQQGPLLHRPKG